MKARLNTWTAAPQTMQAFVDFSTAMEKDGVEPSLAELVKIRASQINHCAFCLHMHTREALARGESEVRLTCLRHGRNRRSTPIANAPRWPGRRRLRVCPRRTRPMRSMKSSRRSSRRKSRPS